MKKHAIVREETRELYALVIVINKHMNYETRGF